MQQVMYWQKGTVDICATSLVTGIMVNIIKNGNNETLSIFHVYTSPGPIFHVDSEYEVRNQIWDLCQVLWADVISQKFLIKYYEYSFDYLINIMNQLRLTCYLVYSTVCFLTGHRLTELTK